MGTPEFAVASLDALYQSDHEIVAVVTAPDKPAGRGKKLRASAVKEYATGHGIDVWQPTNLKNEQFVNQVKSVAPDLIVVVAFRMLPKLVWEIPPMGTINLHASLLPQYRGAAPINWAIINGEKETGVTTFFINEAIDTGDLIDQQKVAISPEMNAGDLHDLLMTHGASLLVRSVDAISENKITRIVQPSGENTTELKAAPKISKEHLHIDWSKPADEILRLIRGMSPYPGAYALSKDDGMQVKIYSAEIGSGKLNPGEIKSDSKSKISVGTGSEPIQLLEIQIPGKRKMAVRDFLNGFPIETLTKLG